MGHQFQPEFCPTVYGVLLPKVRLHVLLAEGLIHQCQSGSLVLDIVLQFPRNYRSNERHRPIFVPDAISESAVHPHGHPGHGGSQASSAAKPDPADRGTRCAASACAVPLAYSDSPDRTHRWQ